MPHNFKTPYTESELEDLKALFRSLPSYNAEDWINPSDIPLLIERMEWPRTKEQKASYVEYWRKNFGEQLPMDTFMDMAAVLHSMTKFARENAIIFDKDKDGFISAEEFNALMEMLSAHDPRLAGKTYEDFVNEADLDKDGKVSIAECTRWIQGYSDSREGTPTLF